MVSAYFAGLLVLLAFILSPSKCGELNLRDALTKSLQQVCSRLVACTVTDVVAFSETEIISLLDRQANSTFVVVSMNRPIDRSIIDSVLMSRPWWTNHFEAPLSTSLSVQTHASQSILAFRRVPHRLHDLLGLMAKRSFVSEQMCEHLPLMVSIHEDNTWGIRFYNIGSEYFDSNWFDFVFNIHIQRRTGVNKCVIYFAGENDCTNYVNKWECLFLPLTNCTMPRQFIDCHEPKICMSDPWTYGIFTNASIAGQFVPEKEMHQFREQFALSSQHHHTQQQVLTHAQLVTGGRIDRHKLSAQLESEFVTAMHSTALPWRIDAAASINATTRVMDMHHSAFFNGFATRFNSHFRDKVTHIVHKFRQSFDPPFEPFTRCHALHIRMDDRTPKPGTNITTWCNACASFTDATNTTRKDFDDSRPGCKFMYSDWMDMGCLSALPFGLATVEHFINASIVLNPDVEDLYVMTDDMNWTHTQLSKHEPSLSAASLKNEKGNSQMILQKPVLVYGRYRVHVFPVRPNHRHYTLQASEDFWASLQIAQQCDGFVGHFGSTVTSMILRTMCYYHNHHFLRCPAIYDISARVF